MEILPLGLYKHVVLQEQTTILFALLLMLTVFYIQMQLEQLLLLLDFILMEQRIGE